MEGFRNLSLTYIYIVGNHSLPGSYDFLSFLGEEAVQNLYALYEIETYPIMLLLC